MSKKNLCIQTHNLPFEDFQHFLTYKQKLQNTISWSDVGILIDEGHKTTLIVLLEDHTIRAVLRLNMSVSENSKTVNDLCSDKGKIFLACFQGEVFNLAKITSLVELNLIWKKIKDQTSELDIVEVNHFFQRLNDNSKEKGRGKDFSVETKRKVMQYSHGRCMFEGCGENLQLDELTGTEGNFAYLAHNVGSSENMERGIKVLSGKLSDDPKNILLLCDKHHRLIDRVAGADFPAIRLSEMRRGFITTANKLLDGLCYQPIPAFAVLWPVHSQVIAAPSNLEVSQSLQKINARLVNQLNDLSDNETLLRESDSEVIWKLMPDVIKRAADTIISQTHQARYKAGLFAFGLMPPLIALGAKIGNKNEIVPMLRYRDGNSWMWPADKPRGKFYSVEGSKELSKGEESIISLALTEEPKALKNTAEKIAKNTGAKIIKIKALPNLKGNGALAHPADGIDFTNEIQILLHQLKDKYRVKRVHILPCASNAACVFFGKAFDNHHPDLILYDYLDQSMIPRIIITSKSNKCVIEEAPRD